MLRIIAKGYIAGTILALALAVSCSKNMQTVSVDDAGGLDGMTRFAVVLSKAIAGDKGLRDYIKAEALDSGNEICYRKIRSVTISDHRSVREHLLDYSSENEISEIEKSLPELFISIPDWRLIGAFGASSWDTSSEDVLVAYGQSPDVKSVLLDGNRMMELEKGEFLDKPILFVENKSVASSLKGFPRKRAGRQAADDIDSYEFRGRKWYTDSVMLEYVLPDDFVPRSDIPDKVIAAYDEFRKYPIKNACQRDYVYYGMSHDNVDHGCLNRNVRERLYRFRIDESAYKAISDQFDQKKVEDNDPRLNDPVTVRDRNDAKKFEHEIMEKIWSGGEFDFRFDFYIPQRNATSAEPVFSKTISVPASELFALKCARKKYKKQTTVAKGEYVYSFEAEDLVSKWVNVKNVYLPLWDISENSNTIFVVVYEVDGASETESKNWPVFNTSSNIFRKVNAENIEEMAEAKVIKTSFGLDSDTLLQTSVPCALKSTINIGSDFLEYGSISYSNTILSEHKRKIVNSKAIDGYSVSSNLKKKIHIVLLPEEI